MGVKVGKYTKVGTNVAVGNQLVGSTMAFSEEITGLVGDETIIRGSFFTNIYTKARPKIKIITAKENKQLILGEG